jgi:hypothetical protein
MSPDNEKGRPGQGGLSDDQHDVTSTLNRAPDVWSLIQAGWALAGDTLPRRGSLAWRCLPADDPVRLASLLADDLEVDGDLRRHGPAVAKALQEVAG